MLQIGENDSSASCNFKELRVVKRSHIQLSRYPADFDLFGRLTNASSRRILYIIEHVGVSAMALASQFESADTASAAEPSAPVQWIEIIVHAVKL